MTTNPYQSPQHDCSRGALPAGAGRYAGGWGSGVVDRDQRDKLSRDLRRLVTGRMTNDDFDDLYFDAYEDSPDDAVREIARFGWGLYSSDVLMPYRLKGRHRVNGDEKQAAARCVLFLRTDRPYQWPPPPSEPARRAAWALALNLGLTGSIAMLVICLPLLLFGNDWLFASVLVVPSAAVLVLSLWVLIYQSRVESPALQAWKLAGDWHAWPFLKKEDLAAESNGGREPASDS